LNRYGGLFEKTFNKENLYAAYLEARKGKRKKKATFEFEQNLGANINDLYVRINRGDYVPDPYFQFKVYEPKERIIHAPSFRDVVVQHAIYRQVYQIFDRSFISTSFACRVGYGTHKASAYTQLAMRKHNQDLYTLKLDIRKFFYSIDRNILKQLIERKIKGADFIKIMILFAEKDSDVGIPIGNLLSQIYALIYLNPMDHYIKRQMKVQFYVRYVDDFVLIGLKRDECIAARAEIVDFIAKNLKLSLSKSTIQKIKKGINFVGYRTWQRKKFIRKYSLYKFFKMMKANKLQSVVSIAGHAKNTNSLPYMMRRMRYENPRLLNEMPNFYRIKAL
jgi:RNA-directed DNA polymerase